MKLCTPQTKNDFAHHTRIYLQMASPHQMMPYPPSAGYVALVLMMSFLYLFFSAYGFLRIYADDYFAFIRLRAC